MLETRLSELAANAAVDAVTALLDGGTLVLFADDVLLAELPFAAPAFAPAADGVAVARPMRAAFATGAGRATRFVCRTTGGAAVLEGPAGVVGCPLTLDRSDAGAGAPVSVEGFTVALPTG